MYHCTVRLKCILRNVIFSAPIQDKYLKFLVKIPLTNDHLFSNNFVCLSISLGNSFATYGRTSFV